jgi:hypothetical protein
VTLTYKGKEDVLAGCTFRTWKAAKDYAAYDLRQVQVNKEYEQREEWEQQQAKLRRDPTWQAQEAWEQQKRRYNQRQQRRRRKY